MHQRLSYFKIPYLRLAMGSLAGLCVAASLTIAISPAIARAEPDAPPDASTVWRGLGRIVNGQGQGGAVQLVLETTDSRIRTHSGPQLDAQFSGGSQTLQTSEGTWQIENHGNRLDVTLYRGQQVIRYHLTPDSQLTSDGDREL